ncbi:MAG TPA: LLM class F420-dependent oxidoreductase [Acidimicrobiales bacterium]|nr:LLM class F420-dependent oxidoreductase [Acidimicrobiales bacterium]
MTVQFAVLPPVRAGVCADPDWMIGFARHAEALGFESIVLVEHPVVISSYTSTYPYAPSGRMPLADDCAIPDPLDVLAFIAAATSRLQLATGVLVLPAHHPVIMAKRLATIDALSKGRVRLCVGVGWMREELEACGIDFSSRGRRTDECIDVMRALWADTEPDGSAFDGEFFHFSHAHTHPKPSRPGGVPIHIGGHSSASIRRAARRGDGWHPLGIRGEELTRAVAELHREAEAAGRDPGAIELTLTGVSTGTTPETPAELEEMGVDRLVVTCLQKELAAAQDEMAQVARTVGLTPG